MQLGQTAQKLEAIGVKTLGVVATEADRARLYFRFRQPRMPMGADPELTTHRAYGLPSVGRPTTPEAMEVIHRAAARELGLTGPASEGAEETLARLYVYNATAADDADQARHDGQLTGQFLVDRAGVVRWANLECAREGMEGIGKLPPEDELLAAARALS